MVDHFLGDLEHTISWGKFLLQILQSLQVDLLQTFLSYRCIKQGCPLTALLSLLAMEGLSKLILQEKHDGISHLLFMEDSLFGIG